MTTQEFTTTYLPVIIAVSTGVGVVFGWAWKVLRSGVRDKLALQHNTEAINALNKTLHEMNTTMHGMASRISAHDARIARCENDVQTIRGDLIRHIENVERL
jgi:hypothetical protein